MKSYKEITTLDEALIILGKRAYPKSGHIVILAGGAASGKGFVIQNLLGIEGKIMDVDDLKRLVFKMIDFGPALQLTLDDMYDAGDIKKKYNYRKIVYNPKALGNPDIVKAVHITVAKLGLKDKKEQVLFTNIEFQANDKKPNIIFDVTLKNYTKLITLSDKITHMGYEKKKIHIVWVVNDVAVAMEQNKDPSRGRVVPEDILFDTHKGASITMADIISNTKKTRKYMDGAIYLAFNKKGVDAEIVFKDKGSFSGKKTEEKTATIIKANYIKIKEPGKDVNVKAVTDDVKNKILAYVPKNTFIMD